MTQVRIIACNQHCQDIRSPPERLNIQNYTLDIARKAKDNPKLFWFHISLLRATRQKPCFVSDIRFVTSTSRVASHFPTPLPVNNPVQ